VVAAYFYLRLIVVMYLAEGQVMAGLTAPGVTDVRRVGEPEGAGGVAVATVVEPKVDIPVGAAIAIGVAVVFTIGVGLVPQPFIDFARHAMLLRL